MNIAEFHSFPWKELHTWYTKNGRHDLPWRIYTTKDISFEDLLYRIWLAEILLQQTQVERVIPFLEKILQAFPTVHALAGIEYDTFFPYYKWLGYYSRARNILKTAKIISTEHSWIFPNDEIYLKKLPWVWPYTIRAIQAFWYGISVLAWDTNLEKVFSRFFFWNKNQKLSKEEKIIVEESFREYISQNMNRSEIFVRDINNALMDFSRILDLKNPEHIDWESYPLKSWKFYETRWSLEPIIKKDIQRFPTSDACVVVILHEWHKKYYSSQKDIYTPYILPWVWENNTRLYIQEYFLDRYKIEVSVRPVHKKWMWEDHIPYIAVYAQIQKWVIQDISFLPWDIEQILKQYKK